MQGESIQLHCSIQPGRLSQYYSASWDRSGEPIHTSSGDRYSINPTNLSLVIKKLHLNDTSDDYHCIVTVTDPNSRHMQTYDYHDTLARNNISLVVLGE